MRMSLVQAFRRAAGGQGYGRHDKICKKSIS